MRLLWLGNSNDSENYLPEQQRPPYLTAKALSETLKMDVDVEVHGIWPSERLPSLVETWVDNYQPNLVFLQVIDHPFSYESVPLKLQRNLGWFGKPLADAGLKAADVGWLSSTSLFHAGRRLARRTIGGATSFTPQEVLERMSVCVRIVLRNEDTALLVRGPHGPNDHFGTPKRRARGERRRQVVHQGLRELCEELHVTYHGKVRPAYETDAGTRVGDRFHFDAAANIPYVDELTPWLIRAWAQQHSEIQAAATETPR